MNFTDTINEWVEHTESTLDDVLQTIVIQIGTSLVRLSPVDTGLFKGNWQLSIDSGTNASLVRQDPDGAIVLNEIASKANSFTAGQVAYIQNHLTYGYDLEYGYSMQAPRGMVRVTAARFRQIVEDAVRLNK